MSEVIDQRTVEMRFDNKDFEKNVETSLATIDKLKQSLNFRDAEKGFDSFSKSLNTLNFNGLNSVINGLDKSFGSLLKTIGSTYVIREGMQVLDSFKKTILDTIKIGTGLSNIKPGWSKYEQETQAVQTIMNATGKSIDEVSRELNKLTWYADETSYSFTDMVTNIGKFTSAGVDLGKATKAMMGISNWAAASGQGTQEASRAMYNLSQAMAVGAVKYTDWRSIELASMGTKEFKQTVMDTAVEMGILEKKVDKYYTKIGKKQEVTTQTFGTTLSTGWFTSDLLVKTLNKYSDYTDSVYNFMKEWNKLHPEESIETVDEAMKLMDAQTEESGKEVDKLGKKWLLAAQQAVTFKQVIESLNDALSSQWMITFRTIFGNYEEVKGFWTDLANQLNEVFVGPAYERNDFLSEVMVSNYTKVKEAALEAGLSIDDLEKKVYEVAGNKKVKIGDEEIEGQKYIDDLVIKYGSLSNAIANGKIEKSWLTETFEELSSASVEGKKTYKNLEEMRQIVSDTINTSKYGVGEERVKKYKEAGLDAIATQKLVDKFMKKGKIELEDLEEVGIEAGDEVSTSWKEFVDENKELIDGIDQLSGRQLIIGSFTNSLGNVLTVVKSVQEGFGNVFHLDPEETRSALESIYNFTESLKISEEGSEKLTNFVTALAQPIKSIGVVAKKFIGGVFGDSVKEVAPLVKEKFGAAAEGIYTFQRRVAKVFKSLETSEHVDNFIKGVSDKFKKQQEEYGKHFTEFKENVKKTFSESSLGKSIQNAKDLWTKTWTEVNTGGKNAFDTFIEAKDKFFEKWKENNKDDFTIFNAIGEDIKTIGENIKTWFENDFSFEKSIFTPISNTITEQFNHFKESLMNGPIGTWFENDFKNSFLYSKILDPLKNHFENIKTWFGNNFSYKESIFVPIGNAIANQFNNFKESLMNGPIGTWFEYDFKNSFLYSQILNPLRTHLENARKIIGNLFKKETSKTEDSIKTSTGKNAIGPLEIARKSLVEGFDTLKENFKKSNLYKKIKPIGDAFEAAKKEFDESIQTESFMQSIKNAGEKFSKFLKYGSKGKQSKVGELVNKVTGLDFQHIADGKILNSIQNKVEKFRNSLYSLFRKEPNRIKGDLEGPEQPGFFNSEAFEKVKTVLTNFWNWAKPLLKQMAEGFAASFNIPNISNFLRALATFNWSRIGIEIGNVIKNVQDTVKIFNKGFPDIIDNFKKFIEKLGSPFSSTSEAIKNFKPLEMFSSFTKNIADTFTTLKEERTELKARAFLEIASGIALVAGALYLLAKLDKEKLIQAGITVGAIAIGVAAIVVALAKITKDISKVDFGLKDTAKMIAASGAMVFLSLAMINIAAAVVIITNAVKQITGLGWNHDTLAGVLGVIGLIAGLASGVAIMKIGGFVPLIGAATAILALATGVRILMDAVITMTALVKTTSTEEFAKGIGVIIALIFSLGASVAVSGLGVANIFGGTALSILAMAAAIRVLMNAVQEIYKLAKDPEKLDKAVDAIKELMLSLGSSVFRAGWGVFGGLGTAATIFSFVGAIRALQDAVIEFSEIPTGKLFKGIDAIKELLSSLSFGTFLSGITRSGLFNSLTVMAIAKGVQMLADVVKMFYDMNIDQTRLSEATGSVVAMTLLLSFLSVAFSVLSKIELKPDFSYAAFMASMGIAIKMVSGALVELSSVKKEDLIGANDSLVVISACLLVLTNVTNLVNHWKPSSIRTSIGTAITIISFATAIRSIANTFVKLGELDEKKLSTGKEALKSIALSMIGMIGVMGLVGKFGKYKGFGTEFLALGASMIIFAKSIEKLGGLEPSVLWQGVSVMTLLIVAVGTAISVIEISSKVPNWTNAANIIAMAASIRLLADAATVFAEFNRGQLIKAGSAISGLLIALTLISRVAIPKNSIISAVSLALLTGTVVALGQFAKSFKDMEWTQLGKVGAALAGLVGAIAIIGKVMSAGSLVINPGGIIKFGVAVAAVGGVLAGLGGLYSLDFVKIGMERGGLFLEAIGRSIGKFFGGIATGATEGIIELIPKAGTALSSFAENAEPFFTKLPSFDSINVIRGLSELTNLFSKAMWADFINSIHEFIPEDTEGNKTFASLEALGNGLSKFTPGFEVFITSLKDADSNKLSETVKSLDSLTSLATTNPLGGGALETFGNSIIDSCGPLKEAITELNELPSVTDNAKTAISSLNELGKVETGKEFRLDLEAPFWSAVFSWKDVPMESFTEDLRNSTGNINAFIEEVNKLEFESDAKTGKLKVTQLSEMLKSLSETVVSFKSDSLFDFLTREDASLSKFATDLSDSTSGLQTFAEAVNEKIPKINMANLDLLVETITKMSSISMPTVSEADYFLTPSALIQRFQESLNNVDYLAGEIEKKKGSIDVINNLTTLLNPDIELDFGKLEDIPEKIREFVEDVSAQLEGITIDEGSSNIFVGLANLANEFAGKTKDFGFTKFGSDVYNGLIWLAKGNDGIESAKECVYATSNMFKQVLRIQNDFDKDTFGTKFNDMVEALNENLKKLEGFKHKLQPFTDLFNAVTQIQSIDFGKSPTSEYTKFGEMFSTLSDGIDLFNPSVSSEDINAYLGIFDSISEKDSTFQKASDAISKFSVDAKRLEGITNFLNLFKSDWVNPVKGSTLDFDWTVGENIVDLEDKQFFTKIGEDLAGMNSALSGVTFGDLSTITTRLHNFVSATQKLINDVNPEEIKKKLIDVFAKVEEASAESGNTSEEGSNFGSKLDSLKAFLDQLKSFQDENLSSVIPDTDIDASAISQAIQNIAEALSGLDDDKISIFDSMLENLANASSELTDNNESTVALFVTNIANAIVANHYQTDDAITIVVTFMILVLKSMMNLFVSVGEMIVGKIAEGMLKSTAATSAAVTVAGRISDAFRSYIQEKGSKIGTNFVEEVSKGLQDESAKKNIQDAIDDLFGINKEDTGIEGEDIGTRKSKNFIDSVIRSLTNESNVSSIQNAIRQLFEPGENPFGEDSFGGMEGGELQPAGDVGSMGESSGGDYGSMFIESLKSKITGASETIHTAISDMFNQDSIDLTEFNDQLSDQLQNTYDTLVGGGETGGLGPLGQLKDILSNLAPDGEGMINHMMEGMIIAFGGELSEEVVASAAAFAARVSAALQISWVIGSPSRLTMWMGEMLIEGLRIGIESNEGRVINAIDNLAENTSDSMTDTLGIHSPSTVFYNIGHNMMEGLGKAIDDDTAGIFKRLSNLGYGTTLAFRKGRARGKRKPPPPIYSEGGGKEPQTNTKKGGGMWKGSTVDTLKAAIEQGLIDPTSSESIAKFLGFRSGSTLEDNITTLNENLKLGHEIEEATGYKIEGLGETDKNLFDQVKDKVDNLIDSGKEIGKDLIGTFSNHDASDELQPVYGPDNNAFSWDDFMEKGFKTFAASNNADAVNSDVNKQLDRKNKEKEDPIVDDSDHNITINQTNVWSPHTSPSKAFAATDGLIAKIKEVVNSDEDNPILAV